MYQARYIKIDGTAGAEVALPSALFDGVIHEGALHEAVTAYLANQRRGVAHRKNRAAVAGGSRKPWRQKGTGRARQGTIRAAQWRGGGMAFPPSPAPGPVACRSAFAPSPAARPSTAARPREGWRSSRASTSRSLGRAG